MRIHRSAHSRAYTVVSNAVLQDNQLSFVARGVLGYLLSLRDGTQADVRTLAKLCKTGRDQIAGALNELKARGYYVVERVQDEATGRWVTRTVVREDPQAVPAAGEPDAGAPGRTPEGESTGGRVPPSPGRRPVAGETEGGEGAEGAAETEGPRLGREDAALVRRLGQVDARLRIGEAEAAPLVPLIGQWRARGVGEAALVHVLTAELPPRVFAPVRFVASRLTRKLPPQEAVRAAGTAGAAPVRREECEECGRPLRSGGTGSAGSAGRRCGPCVRPEGGGENPWAVIARDGRARVRAALAGAALA